MSVLDPNLHMRLEDGCIRITLSARARSELACPGVSPLHLLLLDKADSCGIIMAAFPSLPYCRGTTNLTHQGTIYHFHRLPEQQAIYRCNVRLVHSAIIAPTVGIPVSCVPLSQPVYLVARGYQSLHTAQAGSSVTHHELVPANANKAVASSQACPLTVQARQ
ncbi:hypothetical protein HBH64_220150 [Parastagonospora nodorum]|nr:hypothetical protein HBI09_146650 [Parastagonospora nodorum]KAH4091938.1 hypothetical protein HBH46_184320 [Parastagonospora nodorum]KAH4118322.1 hypothetical protein HBH47_141370 [Parastagonospora nodorum]KAH4301737.1 hypothetical protein HBI01_100180 [Parastagonospora nodorum]KAH4306377.1 hypothetical protein HBI02_120550 [Parastagonospora nodorum]